VEPDEKIEATPQEKEVGGTTYHLKLPPEYRHTRAYPVLIVLHDDGQKPGAMLDRWSELAARHGYILAAPEWGGGAFRYSVREHAAVVNTLWDLRRRYQVDSDRVFLFGQGEGGKMAFDVGLAHPDLFAGVLPMAASPRWYSEHYWPNAQYLPFYVVIGDQAGDDMTRNKDQFDTWVPHGYPAMMVQYKGRANEWFGAEPASMFDWMNRKKRFFPVTQMGSFGQGKLGNMFHSYRATDNRFYWVTGTISEACLNGNPKWSPRVLPATLWARIDPKSNTISVHTNGWTQVSVWLARTGQIDFDQRVTVYHGNQLVMSRGKVTPKVSVLLDDYGSRLDRQQLFVARIDFKR
jgi:pimeloyl-ACP methyl ester carboxylesterase